MAALSKATIKHLQAKGLIPKTKPRNRERRPKPQPNRIFEALCAAHGLFEPVPEFRFHPTRKWKFDWAWPEAAVALEVEGGIFGVGKKCPACGRRPPASHSGIETMLSDMEKYNEASIAGWCVVRCLPDDVESGKVFELLKRVVPPANGVHVCRLCRSSDRVNWTEENLCAKCSGEEP